MRAQVTTPGTISSRRLARGAGTRAGSGGAGALDESGETGMTARAGMGSSSFVSERRAMPGTRPAIDSSAATVPGAAASGTAASWTATVPGAATVPAALRWGASATLADRRQPVLVFRQAPPYRIEVASLERAADRADLASADLPVVDLDHRADL